MEVNSKPLLTENKKGSTNFEVHFFSFHPTVQKLNTYFKGKELNVTQCLITLIHLHIEYSQLTMKNETPVNFLETFTSTDCSREL